MSFCLNLQIFKNSKINENVFLSVTNKKHIFSKQTVYIVNLEAKIEKVVIFYMPHLVKY